MCDETTTVRELDYYLLSLVAFIFSSLHPPLPHSRSSIHTGEERLNSRLSLFEEQSSAIMSEETIDQIDYQTYHGTEGSWAPTIILATFLVARYLLNNSIAFQRFIGNQKIHWRRRLGYRDDSKYQMGAGDGSNVKLKRQG
jgi:hypothetical protein